MAKAKKTESADETPKKSTATKKTTKKTSTKKSAAAPAADSSVPSIDTNLAAQAAAKMVANKNLLNTGDAGAPRESSSFKQLKESLNKPHSTVMGNVLGNVQGQKKTNLPFGGPKQIGRNQTFGADVNRTGVPRRTGG
jgi:hypothetical protein